MSLVRRDRESIGGASGLLRYDRSLEILSDMRMSC